MENGISAGSNKATVDDIVTAKEAERKGYERGYQEASGKELAIRRSASTKAIDLVMLKIMLKMGSASKDVKNPCFNSKYADLNSIRETILTAMNDSNEAILIQQYPVTDYSKLVHKVITDKNGRRESDVPYLTVTTRLTDVSTGEYQETDLSCYPSEDTPQAIGSAITYLRRYSLMPLFNIAPADDDGNAGSGRDPMNQDTTPPKPQGARPTVRPPTARQTLANAAKTAGGPIPGAITPTGDQPEGPRPMTDAKRKKLGVIDDKQYDELYAALKTSKLTGKQWRSWLLATYKYNSAAEIEEKAFAGILMIVKQNPKQIVDFKVPEVS